MKLMKKIKYEKICLLTWFGVQRLACARTEQLNWETTERQPRMFAQIRFKWNRKSVSSNCRRNCIMTQRSSGEKADDTQLFVSLYYIDWTQSRAPTKTKKQHSQRVSSFVLFPFFWVLSDDVRFFAIRAKFVSRDADVLSFLMIFVAGNVIRKWRDSCCLEFPGVIIEIFLFFAILAVIKRRLSNCNWPTYQILIKSDWKLLMIAIKNLGRQKQWSFRKKIFHRDPTKWRIF